MSSESTGIYKPLNDLYEFGHFRLDSEERLLLRDGERIPLTPKAFETLLILVERNGRAVEKDELMKLIWPDVAVEDNNLSQNIHAIRKALGENAQGQHYIETLPRRGFRFVGEVRKVALDNEIAPAASPALAPATTEVLSPDPPRRSRKLWWGIGAVAAILAILGIVWRSAADQAQRPFRELRLTRLTTTSNSWDVALSPDGKTLAYVLGDAGQQSLRLKNLETESEREIVPPAEARFRGLTFAPDGNFIYFARKEKGATDFTLYQRHLNSNEQKTLATKVDSGVTFSPDKQHLAFVREDQSKGESALLMANADGTGEKVLAVYQSPDFFSVDGLSWSPDGKTIAIAVAQAKPAFHFRLATVQVNNGTKTWIGENHWNWAMDVAWLIDGKGLILLGKTKDSGETNNQVWRVDYPSGQERRITNDLNDYRGLSVSSDTQKLVTVQAETRANLWLVPNGNAAAPVSITSDALSQNGFDGLDWTPNGQIVFTSLRSGQQDLWITDSKGQGAQRLTSASNDKASSPSVSHDGRYIVFNAGRSGTPLIWRLDIDGKNPQALTSGHIDLQPFCAWQGDWFLYSSNQDGKRTIWKMPITATAPTIPQQLTDKNAEMPVISPDGNWVVCHYKENSAAQQQVAILPAAGGPPAQTFDIPIFSRVNVRWHPDGRGLTFLNRSDDSSNLWLQPLTGGAPKKITNFSGERIFAYAWSRDGKMLVVSRGMVNRDVVMISNFN